MIAQPAQTAAVRRTLHVGVPIEFAFQTLADNMGAWWPATHHIAKTPFLEVVVEPRSGGRWFERDTSGVECEWGTVLLYEPPRKLVLGWHLQPDFQYNPDPALASEVIFEFIAEGPEAARVEFQHWHLERHGAGWEKLRASVDSGWTEVLAPYERSLNRTKG
jgi:uncharacterized protein YndB with AHSA1/START domain